MNNYHSEVLTRIAQTSTVIPDHRAAFRQGYSFSRLPFEEQLAIWNYIWKAQESFYPRIHAFFFLERYMNKQEHHAALWETSVSWQDDVQDWPLCDFAL